MEEIIDYIRKNSWFTLDGDFEDFEGENVLEFSTRKNGNVGDETYGPEDFEEGKRIVVDVMKKFGHKIKSYAVETCDEWVCLQIELKS